MRIVDELLFECDDTVTEVNGPLAGLQALKVSAAYDIEDGQFVIADAPGGGEVRGLAFNFRLLVPAPKAAAPRTMSAVDQFEMERDHVSERARREAKVIDAERPSFTAADSIAQTHEAKVMVLRRDITIADGARLQFLAEAADREILDRRYGRDDADTSRRLALHSQIKGDRLRAHLATLIAESALDGAVSTLEASWAGKSLQAAE